MSDDRKETFTPGPWVAGWNGGKSGPTCPTVDGPTCGGKKWGYIPVGYGVETVAIVVQQDREGDLDANAHLIAAAPELYEAPNGLLAIIKDSAGVSGFHLNGAVAEWGEFEEVGVAIAALSAARGAQS